MADDDQQEQREWISNVIDIEADGLRIVGIIPARAGSKGLPDKNIHLLLGKPLIYYTIVTALAARCLDRVIVSTDSDQIAQIAKDYGAEVPFIRPAELAVDDMATLPVVRHAATFLAEQQHYQPDLLVTLQPTSPLRRSEHIDAAVEIFKKTQPDMVMSVCEAEHSPYWMRRIESDGRLVSILPQSEQYTRRQDLPPVYRINGAVYVETYSFVCSDTNRRPENIRALVMDRSDSIDIDDELDIKAAEMELVIRMGESLR